MSRLFSFLLILLTPISVFSQSKKAKKILNKNQIEFTIRGFDSSQPISLDKLNDDITNVVGEFENAFFMYGFDSVSNRVAREITELNNPLNLENDKILIQSILV